MALIPSRISMGAVLALFLISGVLLVPKESAKSILPAMGAMPPDAAQVFERACKDCHSNRTEWPWYSKLPAVRLAMTSDVERARAFFNLSEWDSYTRGQKRGFLAAIRVDVQTGNMPPAAYRWMHWRSRLTRQDRALLAKWAADEAARLRLHSGSVAKDNLTSPR